MVKFTVFRAGMQNAWLLLGCALFGLTASFVLTIEKLHILQNPGAAPSCSINPFISCASAISSAQSEFFGVPLTLFGIIAYSTLLMLSVLLFAKNTLNIFMWRLALGAAVGGFLGIHYLIVQSVFILHVICPWCFGIWLTTPIILGALLGHMPENTLPRTFAPIIAHRWKILAAWYCTLAALLLVTFWDAWMMLI